jgi:hypothetical protein
MAWTTPKTWTVGEVLTAANLNTHLRDNLGEVWRELTYVERTSDLSLSSTANFDVVSSGSIAYTAEPIVVIFECAHFDCQGNSVNSILLYDGATVLGHLWRSNVTNTGGGSIGADSGVHCSRRLTPSAGSHEYKIVAQTDTPTATIQAGTGAAGTDFLPASIRVMQRGR